MNVRPRPANSVARDRAFARYYARKGLRVPVMTAPRSTPNEYRLANYAIRAAHYNAAQMVCGQTIRC